MAVSVGFQAPITKLFSSIATFTKTAKRLTPLLLRTQYGCLLIMPQIWGSFWLGECQIHPEFIRVTQTPLLTLAVGQSSLAPVSSCFEMKGSIEFRIEMSLSFRDGWNGSCLPLVSLDRYEKVYLPTNRTPPLTHQISLVSTSVRFLLFFFPSPRAHLITDFNYELTSWQSPCHAFCALNRSAFRFSTSSRPQ
jgi:hypothetical protein